MSNPWNEPSTSQANAPSASELQDRAAQKLASDRLQQIGELTTAVHYCERRMQIDRKTILRLNDRVTALEEAIRFALSKIDRRTSVARRLYSALNNTQQPVAT